MRFPKPAARTHNRVYLVWVRTLPCWFCNIHQCGGIRESHHTGRRGMSNKCNDIEAVPLCTTAHRNYHTARGVFVGMDLYERRAWAEAAIAATQARWATRDDIHLEAA